MLVREDRGGSEPLGRRLERGASANDVGTAVAAILTEIDAALAPILGTRGVLALIQRSLYLSAAAHPFLTADMSPQRVQLDPTAVMVVLAAQEPEVAWLAGSTLLNAFHELLASLVGSALRDQLLLSIWTHDSRGSPAQDTPS